MPGERGMQSVREQQLRVYGDAKDLLQVNDRVWQTMMSRGFRNFFSTFSVGEVFRREIGCFPNSRSCLATFYIVASRQAVKHGPPQFAKSL